MTETITGWLLDVYPNETNLTLWIIGEDGTRRRFFHDFTATLYASGPAARLRGLRGLRSDRRVPPTTSYWEESSP